MALESKELTKRQYTGFVTLPTMLVALAGVLYGGINVIEAGVDAFEGDWTGAGGNFVEALVATLVSSAVAKSGADAFNAKK